MSVNHLERLLEQGEYRRCLETATAMLEHGVQDTESRACIQGAICRSRLALKDFYPAVAAGREAVALATEARSFDVLASAFLDLATGLSQIRQYDEALTYFHRYLEGLPTYKAGALMEGTALERMGETLQRAGRPLEALTQFRRARRWFEYYGDQRTAMNCARALVRIHLGQGELEPALTHLRECGRYASAHPGDREFIGGHLLDRAQFYLAAKQVRKAAEAAFQALEYADDRLEQQGLAQMALCEIALIEERPADALSFAMAARVTAIDGKLYALEFEASDRVFQLLRDQGSRLLPEMAADYAAAGVDIYSYLSEQVLNRLLRVH